MITLRFGIVNTFDKIVTYIGNLVIGGANSTSAVGGTGFATLHEAPTLEFDSSRILDNNIRIESYRLGREGSYDEIAYIGNNFIKGQRFNKGTDNS